MGFLSKMQEFTQITQEFESKKPIRVAFTKKLAGFSDFQPRKEYWACDGSGVVIVDQSNTKIILGRILNLSMAQQREILNNRPKGSNMIEYLNENMWDVRQFSFRDILSSEVYEDGNSIIKASRTSQAASALLGGFMFGETGAVIGGLSGKKRNINTIGRIEVNIVVNNTQSPRFSLVLLDQKNEIPKTNPLYKKSAEIANEVNALMSVLIKRADSETQQKDIPSTSVSSQSIADELTKLSKLVEEGHISKDEFAVLKAKLLGL